MWSQKNTTDCESETTQRTHIMKTEILKKRMQKDRPMKTVSIRSPVDVIEDLKRVAPLRGDQLIPLRKKRVHSDPVAESG